MNSCCEQENHDIRAEIAELRVRDSLTGLCNRKHFYRLASAEVKNHRKGAVQALLYIRPDRFSEIDERFGPLASDAMLRGLGRMIREQVGKHCIVARFGGNIFTVLVVRRRIQEIRELAEHLLTAVSGSVFSAAEQSTCMTISIGVVELSHAIADTTLDQFRAVNHDNIEATFLATRYGVVKMRELGNGGTIVNVAPATASVGVAGQAAFAPRPTASA